MPESDLAERLAFSADHLRQMAETFGPPGLAEDADLLSEAAAEILRLRSELSNSTLGSSDMIESARVEIADLRRAYDHQGDVLNAAKEHIGRIEAINAEFALAASRVVDELDDIVNLACPEDSLGIRELVAALEKAGKSNAT